MKILVLIIHVGGGLGHGFDHLIKADLVVRILAHQRQARGVDRLDRADGVALDARNLHEPAHGIAGQPQIMLHGDLGGVLDLGVAGAEPPAAMEQATPTSP